jgi:hypothetical protein
MITGIFFVAGLFRNQANSSSPDRLIWTSEKTIAGSGNG